MLSSLPILAAFDFQLSALIPIVAIAAPFLMIISIQVAKSIARTQQERLRCEVIRAAIERGQTLPPGTFPPLPDDEAAAAAIVAEATKGPTARFDVRTGLICVGVGFGLYLFFATFQIGDFDGLRGLRWVGAIPGFVGVALIINGLINRPAAEAPSTLPRGAVERRDESRS